MEEGIEPDNCFYIQNEAKVRGKNRLDLTIDPPPDLVLDIDVTSRTHSESYASLGGPELRRFEEGNLHINVLEKGIYQEVEWSPNFPKLPLKLKIPDYLKQVKTRGRNQTMKVFRNWVKEIINK